VQRSGVQREDGQQQEGNLQARTERRTTIIHRKPLLIPDLQNNWSGL
jgi:hypothetical protein